MKVCKEKFANACKEALSEIEISLDRLNSTNPEDDQEAEFLTRNIKYIKNDKIVLTYELFLAGNIFIDLYEVKDVVVEILSKYIDVKRCLQ